MLNRILCLFDGKLTVSTIFWILRDTCVCIDDVCVCLCVCVLLHAKYLEVTVKRTLKNRSW